MVEAAEGVLVGAEGDARPEPQAAEGPGLNGFESVIYFSYLDKN